MLQIPIKIYICNQIPLSKARQYQENYVEKTHYC